MLPFSSYCVCGGDRKYISVKMNRTALIFGIRKDFWNGFQNAEIFIAYDQTYTSKPALFQTYKERTPAFTILFHAFRRAKDLSAATLADANGNKNRNILDLASPAAFQVSTIYGNIGIVPVKRSGTSGFDMPISLFIQVSDDSRDTFVSHKASVTSSTRRTETPARYISIRASSRKIPCGGIFQ